ncbi:monosaccharide ABC transporter ATP-binding protein (CUT2 family) [Herbihabitans rhizosphaerae]|uniref:Monosaccharide ABC transporter ATP-binding protein (CUT2 family) n=1 Tax=Herbihabitans rhizosphaerae TaxID=1872711 RepID=A0A4Q7KJY1_9PSEU|nr:sugar ABC transporter ATP-binding protein [Herbihabitans rhizosphaerae]RZS36506.1 monosaccharide ABC transporter ATP-binding protein (CUT2 family) [Herbihabitans rhizosphaerae]
MDDEQTPVVEAVGVAKRYGPTVALADGRLSVLPGETHGLVGRNGAGKSTLVGVLTGLLKPDAGDVRFNGEPAPSLGDRAGWRRNVACVYQKPSVVGELSVAENLFLHRQPRGRFGLLSPSKLRRAASDLLEEWAVPVAPDVPAKELTVEQRQLVEIAGALSHGARFVILDEPTAQLEARAIARLFDRLATLREQGVTFLFISHHLPEVYEICQRVTVFRDARHVVTAPVAEMDTDALVAAMIGEARELVRLGEDRSPVPADAEPVLELENVAVQGIFEPVDLTVRRGEIVGVAGSAASGKRELAEAVVGLRSRTGTIRAAGRTVRPASVPDSLKAGIGYLPGDRNVDGFVSVLSVAENTTMTVADRLGPAGLVLPKHRDAKARKAIADLDVHTSGPDQLVGELSGGNAQKIVMARALASDPDVLVLVQPTAGVDVRSKESLLGAVDAETRRQRGALLVSDELEDLRVCDRVVVMVAGRVVAEHERGFAEAELVAEIEGIGDV